MTDNSEGTKARAEAAEAREAGLRKALEALRFSLTLNNAYAEDSVVIGDIDAALSTTKEG